MLVTSAAIAQTNITPTTTTTQLSIAAGPTGGIVLPGTHINPSTGRPERICGMAMAARAAFAASIPIWIRPGHTR